MSAETVAQAAGNLYAVDGMQPQEVIFPSSPREVAERVRQAAERGQAVIPRGGGTMMRLGGIPRAADVVLCTTEMNQVLEYEPADLVVTVQAGIRLADLQRILGQHGQLLALDPPLPEQATIGGIIAANSSGPLRLRYGTCRDMLIGITTVLADGSSAKSGGKVVKNVTGYDMGKLYTGSLGTLGVIVEASFKVAPLPAVESTILASFETIGAAWAAARAIYKSALPVRACELLSPLIATPPESASQHNGVLMALWIGGGQAAVERQAKDIRALCSAAAAMRSFDGHELRAFWRNVEDFGRTEYDTIAKISVLPSRTGELLDRLPKDAVFVSHALAGVTYVFGIEAERLQSVVSELGGYLVLEACPLEVKRRMSVWGQPGPDFKLMQRIKQEFDPHGMFNPGRYVGGL
jgi:glycolate oxidase FAD binding subunit